MDGDQAAIGKVIDFLTALADVVGLTVVGFKMSINLGIWLRVIKTRRFPSERESTLLHVQQFIAQKKTKLKRVDLGFSKRLLDLMKQTERGNLLRGNALPDLETVLWILELPDKYENMKGGDVETCVAREDWITLFRYNGSDVIACLRLIAILKESFHDHTIREDRIAPLAELPEACIKALLDGTYEFSGLKSEKHRTEIVLGENPWISGLEYIPPLIKVRRGVGDF